MTKFSKKITIFIDESGTLPDAKDKVIVMAAVGTDVPKMLLEVVKKARKKIKFFKKEKQISEIKFYRASKRTKLAYLEGLAEKKT